MNISHVDDLAHGSATTNNSVAKGYSGYNSTLPVPDVRTQVSHYLKKAHGTDPNALYIVSGGSNDAFFGLTPGRNATALAHDAVHTLRAESERLVHHGARHLLIPTLSEMQTSPWARTYADTETKNNTILFTSAVNRALRAWVPTVRSANATLFDADALESTIQAHPHKYGLTNVTGACLVGTQKLEKGVKRHLCADADRYFFFDLYHPTARVHALLARGAVRALHS